MVSAVATNNLVSIRGERDLLDSAKRLKALSHLEDGKLTRKQRQTLAANHALIHLHLDKPADARKKLEEIEDEDIKGQLLVALALNEQGLDHAIETARKQGDHLSLSQLLLQKGQAEEAKSALLNVKQPTPTILAAAAKICEDLGQTEEALSILEKAKTSGKPSALLKKQLAAFKLRSNAPQEAAAIYEQLHREDANDAETLGKLIEAYAVFDLEKAEEMFSRLPKPDVVVGEEPRSPTSALRPTLKVVRRKRRHPKRVPKNYDAAATPDPERWLPKAQRSSTKKGKKKGQPVRGPQGASVVGGGLGGTGSARIAGFVDETPVDKSPVDKESKDVKKPPPAKKKKGKGKW